ncbi:transglutaminase domain-containing protein [Candidatus Woesearchaeota archaeon]|nr:transglutaminase domain-containing protein [Candidatus Woesearchaeota archaeon]
MGAFKIIAVIILFSLFSVTSLADQWMFESSSVIVDVNITSGIQIQKIKPEGFTEFVTANLSFVPVEDESQVVIRLDTKPKAAQQNEIVLFRWDNPTGDDLDFQLASRMKTKNVHTLIPKKIPFPLSMQELPADVVEFTKPTPNIDSEDPAIIEKASEIAAGEDDLYIVVSKIGLWTKTNVDYNLSTLTADVSQKASWVLENRKGVCDELTSLFIALLRTLGIPARFISGIAYTDSPLFPENWGAHGWAEVYFPEAGWVPFDVTYGEFGFVDPTHVKFKVSADSDDPATRYVWRGRGIEAVADTIKVSAVLVDHVGKVPDFVKLDLRAIEDRVGFGSYNLLEATITNLLDSYQTATVLLSKINELEMEKDTARSVTLAPKESKKAYWLVRVKESLDSRYTYTFPIGVFSLKNTSSVTSFESKENAPVFTKEVMQNIIYQSELEVKKKYSKKVAVSCGQDKEFYYVYDEPKISCRVKNSGNVLLRNLRVCLEQDCRAENLGINQEGVFDFYIKKPMSGKKKLAFVAENDAVSKATFYDIEVFDEPNIEINDLVFPAEIRYGKSYQISFVLKKKSQSEPASIHTTVGGAGIIQTFDVKQLVADHKFTINLDSRDLSVKSNRFTIRISD